MSFSIRTFLLINLLLSVALITSFAIIGNLVISHKDIETQLNTELINVGLRLDALFSNDLDPADLETIQKQLNASQLDYVNIKKRGKQLKAVQPIALQVWRNDQLVLRSKIAPQVPLSEKKVGISSTIINNKPWKVNTIYNQEKKLFIMVAEPEKKGQDLENQLTRDTVIITLIAYPFLGIVIWFIVGRALNPLKKITKEVSHRAPSYLKPVDIRSVPAEVVPLVEELNHLFSRLREAFEREKRFTADAAHELKTPLAAISAQTQVALCTQEPESQRAALKKIMAGVDRSTHVIQQLLTLSRMMPNTTLEQPTLVHLAREACDIAALLAPEAISKNIDLEFVNPDSKAVILGNAPAIGILLRNLLDNAIRYTPENGFIKMNIIETPNQIILSVIDSGPGIPKELRERVFERFYRGVDNASPGSGLGLGIVQQIVKLHQAKIHLLTPKTGKGLQVEVVFPKR